jgi:hypothetical protein
LIVLDVGGVLEVAATVVAVARGGALLRAPALPHDISTHAIAAIHLGVRPTPPPSARQDAG